jgi:dihydroxyacetone kinase-like predicted kinase
VGEVVETPVTVLPTRNISQGLAALLAFSNEANPETNKQKMVEAYTHVQSGEVTYAIRDSNMNGLEIKKGDYLGIRDGKIEKVGRDLIQTACDLLEAMMEEGADVVTIIYGKEATEEQVRKVSQFIEEKYPDTEVEVHDGGQPLYYFLFSVE